MSEPILPIGQPVAGLQVSQGKGAVDWTVDDGTTLLGNGLAVPDVKPDQGGDVVEALPFEQKLDAGEGLVLFDHHLVDFEVERFISPLAGQHVITDTCEGISNEEIAIFLH